MEQIQEDDVLLIVHLNVFISVINQIDAQNFCFSVSLFHASTCFEHHVLIIRRSELHYTASGVITPIGKFGRILNMFSYYRKSKETAVNLFIRFIYFIWCTKFLFYNKFISFLYMFRAHVLIIRRSKLHYTPSGKVWCYCVMQFWPPNDEHMCSKHVQAWNKLIVKQKFCASNKINKSDK